jgi:predicted transcriptional regulator
MTDYIVRKCKNEKCGKLFRTNTPSIKYCSEECKQKVQAYRNQQRDHNRRREEHEEKYKDVPDIPTCKLCGFKSTSLIRHLRDFHNMSQKTYMRKYKAKIHDIYHSSLREEVPTHGNGDKAICKHCGNEFEKHAPRQDYCTPECQKAKEKQWRETCVHTPKGTPRECKQCKKTYTPKQKAPNSKFCSATCRNRWFTIRRYDINNRIKICIGCGRKMKRKTKKRYCSPKCQERAALKRKLVKVLEKNKEKHKHINDPDMPTCKICGLKAKNLTRHIRKFHEMTVPEYRKKYKAEGSDIIHKKILERNKQYNKESYERRLKEYIHTHRDELTI